MDSSLDEYFMRRCLQLAKLGAGNVAPNPMVGAVLVHEGRIIGEGYHQLYGFAHAEVNCVNSVVEKELIPASTMYVSLEPCAHHGKTPPCANLIVAQGIKEVVVGCVDTFSKVAGKGIEILKNVGVTVRTGVLEKECRELNSRFFTFHEQQRPYIILKWAQSANGYMGAADGQPVRISNAFSDRLVHRWRSEEMSILVGANTALKDNPRLNNRLWTGKDPVRVVLGSASKIPQDYHLHDGSVETIYYSGFSGMLQDLYTRNIQSILVEGGANVLSQFINAGLWDEARVIIGTTLLNGGLQAPVLPATAYNTEHLEGDKILYYRRYNTA